MPSWLVDALPQEVLDTLRESDDEVWESDSMLHIDHEHGSSPRRVRGLLCLQCNFDLEAFILNKRVVHPGRRGVSLPRKDPRFTRYLERTTGSSNLVTVDSRPEARWQSEKHSVRQMPVRKTKDRRVGGTEELAGDERQPSKVFDEYWIYAERKDSSPYPAHTERGGKWMLFIKASNVDDWWMRIKAATENGLLGGNAKVATMKSNPNSSSRSTHVVCIYTYDIEDEADCTRVREALRALGVTWKIPYKVDADTYAGKYSKRGDVRISKRYE